MTTRLEVRPAADVFTGTLLDGRSYLISAQRHNVDKLYWVADHVKQLLDQAIAHGSCTILVLSEEDTYPLLLLAASELADVIVQGQSLSQIKQGAYPRAEGGNSTKIARLFDAILYETCSPFSAKLELTASCNLGCRYCYMRGAVSTLLTARQWIGALEALRRLGVVRLEITGGEPLLHEGLPDIVQAADGMGFDTTICTNGVLIDESLVALVNGSRSVDLRISFHSADRRTFDSFVQADGAHAKVIESLHMLVEAGARFSVLVVLTCINAASIYDTIAYLEDAHIDFDVSAFVFPNLYSGLDNREYRPSQGIVAQLLTRQYLSERKSKCSALRTKLWIACNGDILPCEMHRRITVGNIFRSGLAELWTSEVAEDLRARLSQPLRNCDKCSHSLYCGYCPAFCEIYSQGAGPSTCVGRGGRRTDHAC